MSYKDPSSDWQFTSENNSNIVISHSFTIPSLISGTTYHYKVFARDTFGNSTWSDDYTFTTSGTTPPPPDTTPPIISSISFLSFTSNSATITWTTNEPADTQVTYGPTSSLGSVTTLDSSLTTSHTVTVSGLTGGTTYHLKVLSKDVAGNLTTSGDYAFGTDAAPSGHTITSITGNQSSYAPGASMDLILKGKDSTGAPATNSNGYNVQYYIYPASDPYFRSSYIQSNSYNGSYDPTNDSWKISINTPSTTGSYNLRVVLYCAYFHTTCYDAGVHGEAVQVVPFSVQTTTASINLTKNLASVLEAMKSLSELLKQIQQLIFRMSL